ncbi:hypothetical protein HY386_01490 [Candidatus Daviesbacteria bacterium]|nr:hypothetical protein [Candidatus Daviesbacteria bacterium]
METTQTNLTIVDIREDIVLLKDGGAALVLQTTAVNFGLLSEIEQMSIITAFGQMLNSLSYSIQIIIRSKRLDISSYLGLLDRALKLQTSPLFSQLMARYRQFVQSLIKEKEVLDKNFYVVIPLSRFELGIRITSADRLKKSVAMLQPRKDQIAKQLSRVGLKATQLGNKALLQLFYDIYNPPDNNQLFLPTTNLATPGLSLNIPQTAPPPPPPPIAKPLPDQPPPIISQSSKTHPFVVEELADTL